MYQMWKLNDKFVFIIERTRHVNYEQFCGFVTLR